MIFNHNLYKLIDKLIDKRIIDLYLTPSERILVKNSLIYYNMAQNDIKKGKIKYNGLNNKAL